MSNTTEKKRYFEPAPQDIDVENFKKVIQSRRSVRKFTRIRPFQPICLMTV